MGDVNFLVNENHALVTQETPGGKISVQAQCAG